MQVKEIVELVHYIYQMLEGKRIKAMLNSFSENAVLTWGPFEFTGKEEIAKWAGELLDLFTSIHIVDRALTVNEDKVYHEFLIEVVTLDTKKGVMPVSGNYELEREIFQRFDLKPRDSILFLEPGLYDALKF
jgi:hypothetical protein